MGEISITTSGPGNEKINEGGQDKENPESENLIQTEKVENKLIISTKSETKVKANKNLESKPKPEYIDFQKVKKINFEGHFDLENEVLLGIKKNNLEYKFNALEEQIKNQKDIYEKKEQKEEEFNNKKILEKGCCCCTVEKYLALNLKLIGPLFVIFHLVGVFQLINLLESTQNEMMFGIKSFLFEDYNRTNQNMTFNNNIDINYQFENLCFKKLLDFNLIFSSSILGNLLLKWKGYKISSLIFMAINSVVIIIYNSFDFPEEKYDNFYKVLYIILYFIILYISVGSMALFSQQIYFDGLKKYFDAITHDKENNKDQSYFSYLCFTAFPSYFIYIGLYYLFKENFYQNFFLVNIYIYLAFTSLSIIIYYFYSFAFISNGKILKNDESKKFCRIFGYLIYLETKKLKGQKHTNIKSQTINENINGKNENIISNEEKNEINENIIEKDGDKLISEKKEEKKEEEITLKIDIGEKNILIKNNNFKITKNHSPDDITFINNNKDYLYFEDDTCCLSCKLGFRKFFKLIKNSSILSCIFLCNICGDCIKELPETLVNCCKCDNDICEICQDYCYDLCECFECCSCYNDFCHCNCCFCKIWGWFWYIFLSVICFPFCICCNLEKNCDRDDINELYQEEELFCYCYKIQTCISWCCDLLFKNDILEIIIIDIFLELLTIGFGEIIKTNLAENLNSNLFRKNFIIIYILFYLIIAIFNKCFEKCAGKDKGNYANYIYELTGITIWNSFIVTIFSGFSSFGTGHLKEITDNYLILLPYALTKFYYFILINSLVKKMDADNLDLLTNSTIISIFLSIYKIISSILIEVLSIKALILFQFIFALIISIFLFSVVICFIYCVVSIYDLMLEGLNNKKNQLNQDNNN